MKVHVLLYDNFCMFEIAPALAWLSKFHIEAVALEGREHRSDCGLMVRPERNIGDLGEELPDLLVIPGGSPEKYLANLPGPSSAEPLFDYLRRMTEQGRPIAAICGGPDFLARAGLLKGKRCTHGFEKGTPPSFEGAEIVDQPVVVDGNLITARGNAFLRFGLVIMDTLSLFDSEEERDTDIAWLAGSCEFP